MPKDTKPAFKIRCGALSVSIWEHVAGDPEGSVYYTANVQRSFTRDKGQTWEYTDSFSRDDMLTAAKLLDTAHTWIMREEAKQAEAKRE